MQAGKTNKHLETMTFYTQRADASNYYTQIYIMNLEFASVFQIIFSIQRKTSAVAPCCFAILNGTRKHSKEEHYF